MAGRHAAHDHGSPGHRRSGHDHHSLPSDGLTRAFALGIAFNFAFVLVELGAGIWANSMALIADAGHNFSDVIGLVLAGGAHLLSRLPPTRRFTYGFQGSSILASLANAALLMLACGAIGWEAIQRFVDPPSVASSVVMTTAAAGVVVNLATALLFAKGRHGDLNVRGAFFHMTADALVSAAVVLAGLLIYATGARWLDPAVSLIVVGVIVIGSWGLLRDAVVMSLQAVPGSVDPDKVMRALGALPGVRTVHHLHIWPMSTTTSALTAHLVMPGGHPGDDFLRDAAHELSHHFGISHATFQIELEECSGPDCAGSSAIPERATAR